MRKERKFEGKTSRNTGRKIISSPKASNAQRFPCPALLYFSLIGGSRAAAPIGDKVL